MIKAIVYNSNTGFTKKYAEMLSKKIKVPCYEGEKAHYVLESKDEIIFMSWIIASKIKGLKSIKHSYNVKAICAIGLAEGDEAKQKEIKEKNKIKKNVPFFYLRGGINQEKLKGIHKFIIMQVAKILEKSSKKDPESDNGMHLAIKNGADYVDEKNLDNLVAWYNSVK